MTPRPTFALFALLALAACGNWSESYVNPSNWFGGRQADAVVPVATALPGDPRPFVEQVLSMQIETTPGGIIVRATGLPPTQGYWDAELVAQTPDENGRLVLEFHVQPPTAAYPANTQRSREITVAYTISTIRLEGITSIEVRGRSNSKSSRL